MTNDETWTFAYASAIGTSHVRTGTPCQDSALCDVLEDACGNDILFAAVSDGAGSAQRSQEGSHVACEFFRDSLQRWLLGHNLSELSREMMAEWVSLFRLSLQVKAEDEGLRVRDYACTLLLALLGTDQAAFFQIGDGAIVVANRSEPGVFAPFFWPQMGEYANTTNFLTDDDAATTLSFKVVDAVMDEVAVFSDGIQAMVLHYASKTAHAPFFEHMLAAIRKEQGVGRSERLSQGLAQFLASDQLNSKTDDDKTLVLATRRRDRPASTMSENAA